MIPADETFDGTWPFRPQFSDAPGFRMHYVDEGDGPPVVLLHGEPTWGYLFRHVIPRLAGRYRVVVPDHMGFGKSATPPDRAYTARDHYDNFEALLLALDLHDVTLVVHDWGGPIGGSFALRHPGRVRRLVVTNSVVGLGLPGEQALLADNLAGSAWFRWAAAAHRDGTLEEVLGNLHVTILGLMKGLQGFERTSNVTPAWLRAYGSRFATKADCVAAISFPKGIVTGRGADPEVGTAAAVAAVRAKPAMMVYGMRDHALLPQHMIPIFEAAFPDAPVHRLETAGHFLYEDEPVAVAALVDQFIRLT